METKSRILAGIAFAFAIGTAFGTIAAKTVYVRAKFSVTGPTQCINTGVTCEDTGTVACQVQVVLKDGSTAIAGSTGPLYTFQDNPQCGIILFNTSPTILNSPLSGNNRPATLVAGNQPL